jgi:predicted component of type VI protein secretion system
VVGVGQLAAFMSSSPETRQIFEYDHYEIMALIQNLADELLTEIFLYLIDDKLLLCFVAS